MATRCRVWLVEPPVARSPAAALTMAFSSTIRPMGVQVWRLRVRSATAWVAPRVRASRRAVPGVTKAAPGRCRPIISIIIWFELAVP